MSHQLGLDIVYEKLVLLEHFAYGSQRYCSDRLTGSEKDQGDGALDEYWSWLKGIVSSYLIECAVRARILQDTVQGDDAKKLADLDKLSLSGLTIGTLVTGDFPLSLRETCNKIIHAQKAVPEWRVETEGEIEYKYWSGNYRLSGTKGEKAWELVLHVASWARAMAIFLDAAESAELTLYVGQDWY
jgi:hypothetical protein